MTGTPALREMDRPRFWRAVTDLAKVYNLTVDDKRREHYWSALTDLRIDDLEAACALAASRAGTGNCRFFPLPGVLRALVPEAAAKQSEARISPDVAAALASHEMHCRICEDTGWDSTERKVGANVSPHYKPDATRWYARPCACRATNPLYQAKRTQERRITARPEHGV